MWDVQDSFVMLLEYHKSQANHMKRKFDSLIQGKFRELMKGLPDSSRKWVVLPNSVYAQCLFAPTLRLE